MSLASTASICQWRAAHNNRPQWRKGGGRTNLSESAKSEEDKRLKKYQDKSRKKVIRSRSSGVSSSSENEDLFCTPPTSGTLTDSPLVKSRHLDNRSTGNGLRVLLKLVLHFSDPPLRGCLLDFSCFLLAQDFIEEIFEKCFHSLPQLDYAARLSGTMACCSRISCNRRRRPRRR
jgi:hypothetical protein